MLRTYEKAVAIVTGGASGLGVALGKKLIQRGASRVILADIRGDAAKAAASALGPGAVPAELDVRDLAAFRALVDETMKKEGRIDYLFNNAGTGILGAADQHLPEDWKRILDVNLFGVVNGVQAAYPRMIEQRFGHIVNTASIVGLLPSPLVIAYATSKHAIVGLSRALRLEAAHYGVRVTALCPGVVRTPMFTDGAVRAGRAISEDTLKSWRSRITPMEPADFAKAALEGIANNRELVVVPRGLGVIAWLFRALPFFERSVLAKEMASARVEMPELFATATAPRESSP
jgi:NAD(P)-dependent dehydrogenase (short-subunit alcohol dehydrogenase family)